jgi:hypothetical protein
MRIYIRQWRKRLKSLEPSKVEQSGAGMVLSVFFDGKWFTDVNLTLPTNDIDERLQFLRFEYERFTLYSLNTENR